MAAAEQLRGMLAEINEATNNIAADIDRLLDQLEGGVSAADATALIAEFRPVVDQLKAVAAEIPETPPVEPPA